MAHGEGEGQGASKLVLPWLLEARFGSFFAFHALV